MGCSDAGLSKLAEAELRFGARTDAQPHLLAMELARAADAPHQGLRNMKSLVTDYFRIPPATAPERFWELLFPLPYRSDLIRQSTAADLDPHVTSVARWVVVAETCRRMCNRSKRR